MGKLQARLGRELTLYVRQLAWLHATPKPPPGSKLAENADKAPRLSRMHQMEKDGITPTMPPNSLPHIISRLIEIGMTETNGMGLTPLSWREIDAWCTRTGIDLDPWEARLIRKLSAAYVAESRRAEDMTCPPPTHMQVTRRDPGAPEASLIMVLG